MGTSDWDSNSSLALALTKVLTNLKYAGVYLSYFVIFQWQDHTCIYVIVIIQCLEML